MNRRELLKRAVIAGLGAGLTYLGILSRVADIVPSQPIPPIETPTNPITNINLDDISNAAFDCLPVLGVVTFLGGVVQMVRNIRAEE